jgi:hypothetical protein
MSDEKITVACAGCDATEYATQAELEAVGWKIEEDIQLCPLCNFG